MIELGLKFTLGYLIGSVLGGVLVGRVVGVDLRSAGSGNPGSTNALRTQGKAFALAVLAIDIGKGILAIELIARLAIPGVGIDPDVDRDLVTYAVAFAAIAGHVFPVWSDFRGGKGGATAAGVLLWLDPWLGLPVIGVWLLIIALSGFVGLATMSASLGAAAYIGVMRLPEAHGFFVFACCVAALIIYSHRSNIRRMLDGTENRHGGLLRGK